MWAEHAAAACEACACCGILCLFMCRLLVCRGHDCTRTRSRRRRLTSSSDGAVEGHSVWANAPGLHAVEDVHGSGQAALLARKHADKARVQVAVLCHILLAPLQPIKYLQCPLRMPLIPKPRQQPALASTRVRLLGRTRKPVFLCVHMTTIKQVDSPEVGRKREDTSVKFPRAIRAKVRTL